MVGARIACCDYKLRILGGKGDLFATVSYIRLEYTKKNSGLTAFKMSRPEFKYLLVVMVGSFYFFALNMVKHLAPTDVLITLPSATA